MSRLGSPSVAGRPLRHAAYSRRATSPVSRGRRVKAAFGSTQHFAGVRQASATATSDLSTLLFAPQKHMVSESLNLVGNMVDAARRGPVRWGVMAAIAANKLLM